MGEDAVDFVHGALAGASRVPLLLRALLVSLALRLVVDALICLSAVSLHIAHPDWISLRRLNRLISQLWIRIRHWAHGKSFRYVVTLDMLVALCLAILLLSNFQSYSSFIFSLG